MLAPRYRCTHPKPQVQYVNVKRALLCLALFSIASCSDDAPQSRGVSAPDSGAADAGVAGLVDARGGDDGEAGGGGAGGEGGLAGAGGAGGSAGAAGEGGESGGADPDGGSRVHGLGRRLENTSCFLEGAPPIDIVPVDHASAFAALSAPNAVRIVPAGDQLALVESAGLIRQFPPVSDGSHARNVLDLSALIAPKGLRSAAFRPDNAALFVSYVPADTPLRLEVARYALDAQGIAQSASKETLVTLPLSDETRSGGRSRSCWMTP